MPTLYGVVFLFLIVDIFAMGYYRDNPPFHTVGLTLILFGLVAMIHTNSNLQELDLSVERCEPGPAPEGQACYNLEVQLDKPFALKSPATVPELV